MSYIETASVVVASGNKCEDCINIIHQDDRAVIVVADGAGGTGSGDIASQAVVKRVHEEYSSIHSADQWGKCLESIDLDLAVGESTAVIVDLRTYGIAGASVGDSLAWILIDDKITNLTKEQNHKPLIGSRSAKPMSFTAPALDGLLIIATDGLFSYVNRENIQAIAAKSEFYEIPRKLVEEVRLPSGDLWDDTSVVVARVKPNRRTRRRYEI